MELIPDLQREKERVRPRAR
jgi:hypothetical protein